MAKLKKLNWGKKGYRLINVVGGAGYLIALFGYIIFASLLTMAVIPELSTSQLVSPSQSGYGGPPMANDPSLFSTAIAYIIAILGLIITLCILVILPYWIGKAGSRLVMRLQKLLRVKPSLLSAYIAKTGLSLLPFIAVTIAVMLVDVGYAFELLVATAISSFVAVVIFSIQSIMAVYKNRQIKFVW